MYFSRITFDMATLPLVMRSKLSHYRGYALHQWLWQLFPEQDKRTFVFREQSDKADINSIYLISSQQPNLQHNLLRVECKPYQPQLKKGMQLLFALRANPVVTRDKKRYDVLMDIKFQAKQQGIDKEQIKSQQEQAAIHWLAEQGKRGGFSIASAQGGACRVVNYQQHRWQKPSSSGDATIQFSSVDYEGYLCVTEPEKLMDVLYSGLGKSKAFGCGMLLIKRI